jgi:hypothetical protein
VITKIPPGYSLAKSVFPESLLLAGAINSFKQGVSLIKLSSLCFDKRLAISTVGCTSNIGPGAELMVYPSQLLPLSVFPVCAANIITTLCTGLLLLNTSIGSRK